MDGEDEGVQQPESLTAARFRMGARHVRVDHHQLLTQQDWQASIPHCYRSGFRGRIYPGGSRAV